MPPSPIRSSGTRAVVAAEPDVLRVAKNEVGPPMKSQVHALTLTGARNPGRIVGALRPLAL